MDHARKTAIITGASRGIGRGIAFALAEKGYDLFITHLDEEEEANEVSRQLLADYGTQCKVLKVDLSQVDAPELVINTAIEAFGSVHVLVNNAGISRFKSITIHEAAAMDYIYQLNFRAPMLTTKFIANHMISKGIHGSIVNITSSRAERAYPLDAVYGGMKAGLLRATQSNAIELAPYGIRVNSIGPGAIQVRAEYQESYDILGPQIPLGRVGKPSDIGQTTAWLVSDEASYITGINLRVDGGLILPGMPENIGKGL
ncbi:SDR family oxidoreductase [Paenibacillus psychroresistens]|uniref:SDR family oxidoreductase n=1 Tax=Paenibacillus psychroresistens TaxID=1778678 RepID=A0A6B8RTJ5_9BACL|nr:SDR family oxidoreductase [Paenibacillus psychroresistens]QGQ99092.1 SDR family oxidoreductase [Paenibacillus psychroresistens]